MFDYKIQARAGSMYNTPPTYAWYVSGLVFHWLKELGGLEVIAERNRRKSGKLYAFIDASDYYNNPVDPRVPIMDERSLHIGRFIIGCNVSYRGQGGWFTHPQGTSIGGGDACEHIQRYARRGRE